MDVVIVGAGIFGTSLAWWLARAGVRVTLVDQLEAGDGRQSSGGETRLLRCAHGPAADYTAMAWRARTLWRELEGESGEELFVPAGLAWFAHGDRGWEAASQHTMSEQGIPVERLAPDAAADAYPSFRGDDLAFVLLEPDAGVLRADRSVRTLAAQAVRHGATIVRGRARPDGAAAVVDGRRLAGDAVVWACGPWLSQLFPDFVGLRVTRQELLFFDGGPAWSRAGVSAWCDYDRAFYGTADIDGWGVKAATDEEGPGISPDAELRPSTSTEPAVRQYLGDRFPALEHAPLRSARACRYEITTDTHFLAAPHPQHPTTWLLGGGSGHGFKHGPAMAERVAAAITAGEPLPAHFALGGRSRSTSLRTAGTP